LSLVPRSASKIGAGVALGALTLLGAACSSDSSSSSNTTAAPAVTATTAPLPTEVIPTQPADPTVVAEVPASVKSSSNFVVATDASYPPMEMYASNGTTIVGVDIDLSNALAQTMGLTPKIENATFDTIIPGLQSGKYGMGASSFTDTKARQKVVDFVDYFTAGEAFYVKTGSNVTLSGLVSLCGHSVAVEAGTTEETDAKAQAASCKKKNTGDVTVLVFNNQNQANLAVSSGRADAGFVDSQVAGYIVSTSNGMFALSGSAFNLAPYGLALPKGNGMTVPVQAALNTIIKNGVYNQILTKWGVQAGALTTATINGATS
jgi:polar amino acid transport system substrate-binding protein